MSFRSLEQIYSQDCVGKPVTPLTRHTIVERYKIVLKDEDQVSVDQEISPEMYNKIRREVLRTTKVTIDGEEFTVDEVIDKILKIDAWDEGNAEYEDAFLKPIINTFNQADINPEKFVDLYRLQTSKDNKFRQEFIQNPGVEKNLYDLIPKEFLELFGSHEDARKVFNKLYDINPPIARVAVGRGEIALTFISDAIKGDKGDLDIPGLGEIEIKGTGARLGGDGHAVDRSVGAINNILQLVGTSLTTVEINQLKQSLYNTLDVMLRAREQATRSPVDLATLRVFSNMLRADFTVDDIIEDIQAFSAKLGKTITDKLIKHISNIKDAQAPDRAHSYTSAVRLFFSVADQMTYEKFIDGVVSLRNYHLANRLPNITAAVKSLIPESEYKRFTSKELYEPLVVALHLYCYLLKEHFSYIVFINDSQKRAICFKTEEEVDDNLQTAYKFFSEHNFQYKISVDSVSKSVGVTFFGSHDKV